MKKIIYFFVFIIGFLITFVSTFPAKTVLGYFLTKNNINYSKIEGNILNLKVYDIEFGNIYIPSVTIENNFVKVISRINMENYLDLDFVKRKAKLKLTELQLEKYQKKPEVEGIVSTSIKLRKKQDYIVTRGNGNLLIKKLPLPTFNNTEISWKLSPEDSYSKVTATLKGKNIDGTFNGRLIIPINDTKNIRIKGMFTGKVFGNSVKQEININPLTLRGF